MSVVPTRRVIVVAIALSAATATDAFARHGGGHGGAAGHGGAPVISTGPLLESVPMQQPHFNPSRPYTVPQSPETPVSPGSPGRYLAITEPTSRLQIVRIIGHALRAPLPATVDRRRQERRLTSSSATPTDRRSPTSITRKTRAPRRRQSDDMGRGAAHCSEHREGAGPPKAAGTVHRISARILPRLLHAAGNDEIIATRVGAEKSTTIRSLRRHARSLFPQQ